MGGETLCRKRNEKTREKDSDRKREEKRKKKYSDRERLKMVRDRVTEEDFVAVE